jgi:hypothetical protein
VKFTGKESEVVFAHKIVLASRNEIFNKMFTSTMKESTESEVKVDSELPFNIFEAF